MGGLGGDLSSILFDMLGRPCDVEMVRTSACGDERDRPACTIFKFSAARKGRLSLALLRYGSMLEIKFF